MLFELRQYRTRPGQRENWVRFAEDEIIPFQTAKGMTIVGSWVGEGRSSSNRLISAWRRRDSSARSKTGCLPRTISC